MSSLLELQNAMSRMIFDQDDAVLAAQLAGTEQRGAAGLLVYRNNVFASLMAALADTYPVIERLVGEDFFKACAHQYIRAHPTAEPVLALYGDKFADFLRHFEPAAALNYLPDIAELEYAWLQAYHAADVAPLDMSALQSLSPEQFAKIQLQLHPSTQLVASKFPIEAIWSANRPETLSDATIDLETGPDYVLISRPARKVEVQTISAGLYHLMSGLADERDLTASLEGALAHEPDFDLQLHLSDLFACHLIIDFDLG